MQDCPDAVFVTVAGDNVGMGQFREQWDEQFHSGRDVFSKIPYMPVIGNHDSQDGVPPVLYTQLFGLPQNSGSDLIPERNYTFAYGDARFFVLDVTGGFGQKVLPWVEQEMANATEKWKIVMMHFPPYHSDEYSPILRKAVGPLFDKHGIDLVLSGHIHQYFRSYPMFDGAVSGTPGKGTVYVASMAVKGSNGERAASLVFNHNFSNKGGRYQIVEIDGNRLEFTSKSLEGDTSDTFSIVKP